MGPKTERLTILRAATHETQLGDHDFCLSQSASSVSYVAARKIVRSSVLGPVREIERERDGQRRKRELKRENEK